MTDGLVPPLNAPPAGQPVAGVQPGTTGPIVVAIKVIIYGPNGGEFIYSGTPAAGNLIFTNTAAAGTDPYGNTYLIGATWYNNASGLAFQIYAESALSPITASWYTFTAQPGAVFTFAAGYGAWTPPVGLSGMYLQYSLSVVGDGSSNPGRLFLYDAGNAVPVHYFTTGSGKAVVTLVSDGNTYTLGRQILPATAVPETINQTSAQGVTGCSSNLAAISYRYRVVLQFTANASAGNPSFQVSVSATTSALWGNGIIWQTSGTGAGANRFIVNTSTALYQGPAMVSGAVYLVQLDGFMTCTGTGAISLQAFTSNASDTFTINNAYLELSPV